MSKEARNLLDKLLDRDYEKRISAKEALEHPWIQNIDKNDNAFNSEISKRVLGNIGAFQVGFLSNSVEWLQVPKGYIKILSNADNEQERER